MVREYRNLVDGKLVDVVETYGVINPSTGEVFAQAPAATATDVDVAVTAAVKAQKIWGKMKPSERKEILSAAIAKLKEPAVAEEIAEALVKEQGKPMWGAQFEMGAVADNLTHFANADFEFEKVIKDDDTEKIIQRQVPLGVVAGVVPWNFPPLMAAWKIGESLMTGNTIIIKPSPYTPISTLVMGEAWKDIFPPGTFNILSGSDDIGRLLCEHPEVGKISFTGSTATGKKIQAEAAASMKRLTLECGGNDPLIVLEDADEAAVIGAIVQNAFMNSGQICIAPKRVYVHESKYDTVLAGVVAAAKELKVGDGFEEGVFMGPLNNAMQLGIVEDFVADAREKGATIHCGGERLDRPGYFYPPTVISGVTEGAKIVDREQFGPALPIMKFSSIEEVVRRANSTRYGLGASVWTKDASGLGAEVAAQIESGTVWINQHLNLSPDIPFGGVKESGVGRQFGSASLEAYTESKIIRVMKPKVA